MNHKTKKILRTVLILALSPLAPLWCILGICYMLTQNFLELFWE